MTLEGFWRSPASLGGLSPNLLADFLAILISLVFAETFCA